MPASGTSPLTGSGVRRPGLALAVLAMAQLIIALDIYIVFVALPDIGAKLHFSNGSLQWVVSAYVVAFGGFLLLGGRACDLLGRRNMFLLALGLYAVSSLVGGFAPNSGTLIAVRAVQGLGGALLFPATLSTINTIFAEGKERNRALAAWGGAGASGLTLGSLLGGVLTNAFGWESVFFVNVVLAGAVGLVALTAIPRDVHSSAQRNFDALGAITASAGATLFVYAVVEGPSAGWGSTRIIVSLALALLLLILFLAVESRSKAPLMPLRLFRNRSLVASMAITAAFMGTFGALPYFVTTLFQSVHGYSPLQTGLAFLVPAVSIFAGTQISERMIRRIPIRVTLLIGFVVGAIGTALMAMNSTAHSNYVSIVPGLIVMGVGQGVAWTAMWIAAASGVLPQEQGIASSMAATTQQFGNAIGLGVLTGIADSYVHSQHGNALRVALGHGTQTAVYVAAAGLAVGALVTLALPGRPAQAAASDDITSPSLSADEVLPAGHGA